MSPSESSEQDGPDDALPDDVTPEDVTPEDDAGDPGDFELPGVTFVGAPIESGADGPSFGEVSKQLIQLLGQVNGFVAYSGGLHVRGVCDDPDWHSIEAVWRGEHAFHRTYNSVEPTDIPFAQDCVGDQFLLRGDQVLRLLAETDELEPVADDLDAFLALVQADPDEILGLPPLQAYEADDESLQPGELLAVYPPFCSAEAEAGVSIDAVPVADRLAFLARFATFVRDMEEGEIFEIQVDD